MPRRRKHGHDTRERVLAAAAEVFAANGYREATVAEICRLAGANIAAVNYHFGGKEALYVEAWRRCLRASLEAHPPHGGVRPGAPPAERLHGRVRSIMRRITDPKSHEFDILHKEMANPTGLLSEAIPESLKPLRRSFAALIRELLGPRATEREARFCRMSVMAQCFGPLLRERHGRHASCPPRAASHPPLAADVEALADHVARFSLAGIRDARRRAARLAPRETRHMSRSAAPADGKGDRA